MTDPNFPPPGDPGMPYQEARKPSPLQPVAITMVVYNALSLLTSLGNVVGLGFVAKMMAEQAKAQPEMKAVADIYAAPWMMYIVLGGAVISVIALVGSIFMLTRKSYAMAMIGAIVTIISPGGCCCLVGMGVGIWSLVVLMKDEVQAEFKAH
jgi:hypothetical protein